MGLPRRCLGGLVESVCLVIDVFARMRTPFLLQNKAVCDECIRQPGLMAHN